MLVVISTKARQRRVEKSRNRNESTRFPGRHKVCPYGTGAIQRPCSGRNGSIP